MPNTGVYRYALDVSGNDVDNLVQGEYHSPTMKDVRSIAPTYGPYFTESLKVHDADSGTPLIRGLNYQCADILTLPSALYGKEICTLVLLTDDSYSAINIDYQALGGMYENSHEAIRLLLENVSNDTRSVSWLNILDKPNGLPPNMHLHAIGDAIGFEYAIVALEEIKKVLLMGDDLANADMYARIKQIESDLRDSVLVNELNAKVKLLLEKIDYLKIHNGHTELMTSNLLIAAEAILTQQCGINIYIPTCPTVTYLITSTKTSINEGESITFNIVTRGIGDGTPLYIATTRADFTPNKATITIVGNAATFTTTANADHLTEGPQAFSVTLQAIVDGPIVRVGPTVYLSDTSTTSPSFSITPDKLEVAEGGTVTFTINSTHIADGTILYGQCDDTNMTPSYGDIVINSGVGTFTTTINLDDVYTTGKTFKLMLYTAHGGTLIATSANIDIIDTNPFYKFSSSNSVTVNEGGSLILNVETLNVPSNTTLWWRVNHITTDANDFTAGNSSGTFKVNNNIGSFALTTTTDNTTEGNQTFTISISTSSNGGAVATTPAITIIDTSVTPSSPVATVTVGSATVGDTLTVNYSIANYPAGGAVTYTVSGGATPASGNATNAPSGSFNLSAVTAGSVSVNILVNGTVVGSGTGVINAAAVPVANVSVGSAMVGGTIAVNYSIANYPAGGAVTYTVTGGVTPTSGALASTASGSFNLSAVTESSVSVNILVNGTVVGSGTGDVSAVPVPTYVATLSPTTVNEGDTITAVINTTNLPDGTQYHWLTNIDDVIPINGYITINNNTATFNMVVKADATTEGNEAFVIGLYTAPGGTLLCNSNHITINDTSMTPTFSITTQQGSYNEGDGIAFYVNTTNVPDGSVYYINVCGNDNSTVIDDFKIWTTWQQSYNYWPDIGNLYTSVTIVNNYATAFLNITEDLTTEGTQTAVAKLTKEIGMSENAHTVLASTPTLYIYDTSITPAPVYWYNVSVSHYVVNEGEMSFTTTVESNDYDPRGYAIYATGTGIGIEDFDLGTETGTASYLTTGTFTITLGITLDIR